MKFWMVNILVLFFSTAWVLDVFADQQKEMRVISVNGALTEIIYQLNSEEILVGVDTTSLYPSEATQLPQVGYQRNLSVEGILSLQPTHIIFSADAGPPAVLKQLQAAGVEMIQFEKDYSVESVVNRILTLAQLLGKDSGGQVLVKQINKQFLSTQKRIQDMEDTKAQFSKVSKIDNRIFRSSDKKRVLFLLTIASGSPMAAGSNTSANAMIQLAGGHNVFQDFDGYKPVSTEALVNSAPDEILVVSHSKADQQEMINKVLDMPGIALTPAAKNNRIRVEDGLRFLGFGPRIAEAIDDLNYYLYPAELTEVDGLN